MTIDFPFVICSWCGHQYPNTCEFTEFRSGRWRQGCDECGGPFVYEADILEQPFREQDD